MVRLALDQRRLVQLAQRHRLPLHQLDTGYLAHCALTGLFGELAPTPFSLPGEQRPAGSTGSGQGRFVPVLGYTRASKEQLIERAKLQASPDVYETCDWSSLAAKEMPSSWNVGHRLRFEVRVCPVIRKASAGPHHRDGAEVDAFLAACWQAGHDASGAPVPVDRQHVYLDWLTPRLARAGALVEEAHLLGFQRELLLRRTHEDRRRTRQIERPDARFEGTLRVQDAALFPELLARGVGRHRAFGFGMVLLRPA
jgi:CRISPR system Cascade subunit CasE